MSRRPKTFLVLLLVSMFLMTQVAMAGAASVKWNLPSPVRANSNISVTVYENDTSATAKVYATVYASIIPAGVSGTVYALAKPVLVGEYIYDPGKASNFNMASIVGPQVGKDYQVQLNVYAADKAENIALNTPTDTITSSVFKLAPRSSSDSTSGPGGGGDPITDKPKDQPTTVTKAASAAVAAAEGGTVSAEGISVTVPAGALSGNGTVSITPVTDLSKTPVGTRVKIGSTVVDIAITGASLTGTLTISLDYDKTALADVPAEQIAVYYWNEAREGWVYIGGTVNAATGKVSVDVNHLTLFAVMANPELKIPADISGHWSFDAIKRLLGMGVVSGYPDGSFKPNNNITRAEFCKIMVDAMGWKADATAPLAFADADKIDAWAKGYVATAVSKGLIKGYEDNTFQATNQITRAEIAVVMVKALGKTAEGAPAFADASSIPSWAAGYVAVAAKEGIVAGYTDNTFQAGNNATRAEAAKMTTNLLTSLKI